MPGDTVALGGIRVTYSSGQSSPSSSPSSEKIGGVRVRVAHADGASIQGDMRLVAHVIVNKDKDKEKDKAAPTSRSDEVQTAFYF